MKDEKLKRTQQKTDDDERTNYEATYQPCSEAGLDRMRRGKIRNGKRYLGNGASQAVRYQDGMPADDY